MSDGVGCGFNIKKSEWEVPYVQPIRTIYCEAVKPLIVCDYLK